MSAGKLALQVQLWEPPSAPVRRAVTEQAERLAAHRKVRLTGVDVAA